MHPPPTYLDLCGHEEIFIYPLTFYYRCSIVKLSDFGSPRLRASRDRQIGEPPRLPNLTQNNTMNHTQIFFRSQPLRTRHRPTATSSIPYAVEGDAALSGDTRNPLHYKPLPRKGGPTNHDTSYTVPNAVPDLHEYEGEDGGY